MFAQSQHSEKSEFYEFRLSFSKILANVQMYVMYYTDICSYPIVFKKKKKKKKQLSQDKKLYTRKLPFKFTRLSWAAPNIHVLEPGSAAIKTRQ